MVVQNIFLKKRQLDVVDLYEEPLNRFEENAAERWITEKQVDELIKFSEYFATQFKHNQSLIS